MSQSNEKDQCQHLYEMFGMNCVVCGQRRQGEPPQKVRNREWALQHPDPCAGCSGCSRCYDADEPR